MTRQTATAYEARTMYVEAYITFKFPVVVNMVFPDDLDQAGCEIHAREEFETTLNLDQSIPDFHIQFPDDEVHVDSGSILTEFEITKISKTPCSEAGKLLDVRHCAIRFWPDITEGSLAKIATQFDQLYREVYGGPAPRDADGTSSRVMCPVDDVELLLDVMSERIAVPSSQV